jgi:hypothetical protein
MKRQIQDWEQRLRGWLVEPLQRMAARGPAEPLDHWTEIQKQLRAHIALGLTKQPVFPSRHLTVTFPAADESERARIEGAFEEQVFRAAVVAFLEEEGAKTPPDLWITLDFTEAGDSVAVRFGNERNQQVAAANSADPATEAIRPMLRVRKGDAPVSSLPLATHRVNLGRQERIRDTKGNLVRRNDLHFADVKNGVNETVSRRHAHLEYDPEGGGYRLFRDSPDAETAVASDSRVIDDVPLGGLGILLKPGDVIRLGKAEVELTAG